LRVRDRCKTAGEDQRGCPRGVSDIHGFLPGNENLINAYRSNQVKFPSPRAAAVYDVIGLEKCREMLGPAGKPFRLCDRIDSRYCGCQV
jgi:hypothetical protein